MSECIISEHIALRRNLSHILLIFYGLGNIIGVGFYVLVGKVVAMLISCGFVLFELFNLLVQG